MMMPIITMMRTMMMIMRWKGRGAHVCVERVEVSLPFFFSYLLVFRFSTAIQVQSQSMKTIIILCLYVCVCVNYFPFG